MGCDPPVYFLVPRRRAHGNRQNAARRPQFAQCGHYRVTTPERALGGPQDDPAREGCRPFVVQRGVLQAAAAVQGVEQPHRPVAKGAMPVVQYDQGGYGSLIHRVRPSGLVKT